MRQPLTATRADISARVVGEVDLSGYGSWDGTIESIPGEVCGDGTPDMRDAENRDRFS